MRGGLRAGLAALLLVSGGPGAAEAVSGRDDPSPSDRLERLRRDLSKMREELRALERREEGVLGEIARSEARLRIHRAELEEASLRLEATREAIATRERTLERIREEQDRRKAFLANRVRALYKAGPFDAAEALFGTGGRRAGLAALGRIVHATERDLGVLGAWRRDRDRRRAELSALSAERDALVRAVAEEEAASRRLEAERAARARALEGIRVDRDRRERALAELEESARALGRIAEGASPTSEPIAALDVRAFRGLLDWPVEGKVAAGFGKAVHPTFRTVVPHPGLDLATSEGATFRAVFDGTVAYASSLRGYGLTVLVDHGRGIVSVYANASALVVGEGQEIVRGQVLGRVGDAGSRGSAGIYFEIRDAGRPVDPALWLRRR